VLLLLLYVLSGVLARSTFLQRLLTPHEDLHHQVWTRAEVEFHREGLSDTKSHTAVLLFVSLFERQAVVFADQAIAQKAPPEAWNQVVALMVQGARTGRWAEQLEKALRECGKYLAEHFPPGPQKTNELPDTVIIKD
jgi:putative membrane protein